MALYGTNVPPFQDPEIPTGAAQIRQKVGKNAGAWGMWGHTSGWKKSGL